jgi:hypothetical protein
MAASWRRRFLPLVVVALLAAGCGGDGGGDEGDGRAVSRSTTTLPAPKPAPTSTTTEPADPYVKVKVDPSLPRQDIDINMRYPRTFTEDQIAVVQAWAGYRHVFLATLDPPDPSSTLMEQYATPETVAVNLGQRKRLQEEEITLDIPTDGSLRETVRDVVMVSNRSARLAACLVDPVKQVDARTGEVVNDEVSTDLSIVEFVRQPDGRWLVAPADFKVLREWDGNEEDECLAVP